MYAQVVVLTYAPPDIDAYTYIVPKQLENEVRVGQLVCVPFGKRSPTGIVISTRSHLVQGETLAKLEIKPVTSIIYLTPILLAYQIKLLEWMAFYYHAPMVNCLEAMIPTKALNAKRLMTNAKPISQSVSRSSQVSSQTIVLVPSINRIPETLAQFPQAKSYVVYHSELAASQKFAAWQKISSGRIDYVFGSRLAIFTPCPKLNEIIIYDEHEDSYRDERSPYYNTLTIAEKISQLSGAIIKIIDSSPKITTYFAHSNKVRPAPWSHLVKVLVKVKLVSMLDARRAGNRLPLSQILQDYIKLGYVKNKKILLFLNKKLESGHVYCRNCKLADFASIQPAVCPNCQSPDIWFSSTNVNSLADLVRKIIPQAKITIIAEGYQLQTTNYKLPSIDIATAAVFYKLMPLKYDLVAHVQTDSTINIADFNSAEKLFAQITNLKRITRGLLLLQTYNPDNATITSAATDDYQKFYEDQIAQRKALSYPPFAILVKLRLLGKKEENLEEKANKLYAELNQLTVNSKLSTVSILGPYKPLFGGKTSKYNIILKIPMKGYSLKDREKAIMIASPLLLKIPKSWQVEVEPASII